MPRSFLNWRKGGEFLNGLVGRVRQSIPVELYRWRRVWISAIMKGEGVKRSAGMLVDMRSGGGILLVPEYERKRFRGDLAEMDYEMVFDILPQRAQFSIGFANYGPGRLWFRDVKLEIVDADIPVTGGQP